MSSGEFLKKNLDFYVQESWAVGRSLDNTQSYKMHQVYKHQINTLALPGDVKN